MMVEFCKGQQGLMQAREIVSSIAKFGLREKQFSLYLGQIAIQCSIISNPEVEGKIKQKMTFSTLLVLEIMNIVLFFSVLENEYWRSMYQPY